VYVLTRQNILQVYSAQALLDDQRDLQTDRGNVSMHKVYCQGLSQAAR
jgi:hypothetical protein